MSTLGLKQIIEAALLAANEPLSLERIAGLFEEGGRPGRGDIRNALDALQVDYDDRGVELVEVASGYRIQVRQQLSPWIGRLWDERPPRYSRALLETLAIIAYRQPVTRAEIEEIRGVGVSTNIVRTLLEREWVRIVGHRDVPGRPALFATARAFLDYFNLRSLADLPTLPEIRALDVSTQAELEGGASGPEEDGRHGDESHHGGDAPTSPAGERTESSSADDRELASP